MFQTFVRTSCDVSLLTYDSEDVEFDPGRIRAPSANDILIDEQLLKGELITSDRKYAVARIRCLYRPTISGPTKKVGLCLNRL